MVNLESSLKVSYRYLIPVTKRQPEDLVGRNAEIATVDYNVPVAVVRENTQLCTYFFNPFTPTY